MDNNKIEYQVIQPDTSLAAFVESYWMLRMQEETEREVIVLPDGRIDCIFSQSATEPFHVVLLGLELNPSQAIIPPKTTMFVVSFKLLAVEYLFKTSFSHLLNEGHQLPNDFWGIGPEGLHDFPGFCTKVAAKIKASITEQPDGRKQQLFDLIYASQGALSVKELADKVFWSSRQINRYFNQQFGLSLKTYCNILRFRASLPQIKAGKLFPEQNFTDQAHFIREVKKYAGVTPGELFKNKNDRFIQFTATPRQ
jgi:AraC-like DNA-binding protein